MAVGKIKPRKAVPFEFVLDALGDTVTRTNPMFGCLALYVREKIVLVLRDKAGGRDNGVWLATTVEHHESLRAEFPNMQSIGVLGRDVTGWQILPAEAPDFEEAALRACELIAAGDRRIGKVPKPKRRSKTTKKKPVSRAARKP
ncbi:MAG: hypothetical protein KGN84_14885 [Acidobacteriota bacterium]|nr:hypothetical protein [Acidobacteriota bacterium]